MGASVGASVGATVGTSEGEFVGATEGDTVSPGGIKLKVQVSVLDLLFEGYEACIYWIYCLEAMRPVYIGFTVWRLYG